MKKIVLVLLIILLTLVGCKKKEEDKYLLNEIAKILESERRIEGKQKEEDKYLPNGGVILRDGTIVIFASSLPESEKILDNIDATVEDTSSLIENDTREVINIPEFASKEPLDKDEFFIFEDNQSDDGLTGGFLNPYIKTIKDGKLNVYFENDKINSQQISRDKKRVLFKGFANSDYSSLAYFIDGEKGDIRYIGQGYCVGDKDLKYALLHEDETLAKFYIIDLSSGEKIQELEWKFNNYENLVYMTPWIDCFYSGSDDYDFFITINVDINQTMVAGRITVGNDEIETLFDLSDRPDGVYYRNTKDVFKEEFGDKTPTFMP